MLKLRNAAPATDRLISASEEEGAVADASPEVFGDSKRTALAKRYAVRSFEGVACRIAAPVGKPLPEQRT